MLISSSDLLIHDKQLRKFANLAWRRLKEGGLARRRIASHVYREFNGSEMRPEPIKLVYSRCISFVFERHNASSVIASLGVLWRVVRPGFWNVRASPCVPSVRFLLIKIQLRCVWSFRSPGRNLRPYYPNLFTFYSALVESEPKSRELASFCLE